MTDPRKSPEYRAGYRAGYVAKGQDRARQDESRARHDRFVAAALTGLLADPNKPALSPDRYAAMDATANTNTDPGWFPGHHLGDHHDH